MTFDALLQPLVRTPRCGLLTDIDGTISLIAPTPEAATVSPAIRAALERLQPRLALLAAISGRGAADAAALVGVEGLVVVGNHGLERWASGQSAPLPAAVPFIAPIRAVLARAAAAVTVPGLRFEDKGVTASVHYRNAPDPERAAAQLEAVLTPLVSAAGLRLTAGRMVWEIRPPLATDKGSAALALVAEYELSAVIMCGDDRTDVDAFDALAELRATGRCQTLAVGVVAADTPAEVAARADLVVEGVAGMAALLDVLVALTD